MTGFEFCKKHDLAVDVPYKIWKGVEFSVVDIAFSESYIPTQKSTYCLRLSWVLENFTKLLEGRYKREDMKGYHTQIPTKEELARTNTIMVDAFSAEELNKVFEKLNEEL